MAGARVTVFSPESTPNIKVEKMRALGADVRLLPGTYETVESAAIQHARETSQTWISPYNDPQVVAGQGTIGLELAEQIPVTPEMSVLIPVGGGGLLSGIAAALKGTDQPKTVRIIGVHPEASAFMHALLTKGNAEGLQDLPSLADGLAGGVERGAFTIELVRNLADEVVLVVAGRVLRLEEGRLVDAGVPASVLSRAGFRA